MTYRKSSKYPNLETLLFKGDFRMVVPAMDLVTRNYVTLYYDPKRKIYAFYTQETDKVRYFKEIKVKPQQ